MEAVSKSKGVSFPHGINALQLEEANSAATNRNFFCSRWQSTAIAIQFYVRNVLSIIPTVILGMLLDPLASVITLQGNRAWRSFKDSSIKSICIIAAAVVLPFFFLAGVFAPKTIYGFLNNEVKKRESKKQELIQAGEATLLAHTQRELAQLKEDHSRLQREHRPLVKAERKRVDDQREIQRLRASCTELTGVVEASRDAQAELERLREAFRELQLRLQPLQEASAQRRADQEEIAALKVSCERLQEELRTQQSVMSRGGALMDGHQAALEEARKALESANAEVVRLQGLHAEREVAHRANMSEIERLSASNRELEGSYRGLQGRCEFLQASVLYLRQTLCDVVDAAPAFPYPAMLLPPQGLPNRYPIPMKLLRQPELTIDQVLVKDASYKSTVTWLPGQAGDETAYDAASVGPTPRVTGVAGIPTGMHRGSNMLQILICFRNPRGEGLQILVCENESGFSLPEFGRVEAPSSLHGSFATGDGLISSEILRRPIYAGTNRSTDHAWDEYSSVQKVVFSDAKAQEVKFPPHHKWVALASQDFKKLNLEHKALYQKLVSEYNLTDDCDLLLGGLNSGS